MIPTAEPFRLFDDADELSRRLLVLAESHRMCIFDSCGAGYQKARLMIAGIPAEVIETPSGSRIEQTYSALDVMESDDCGFDFFTLSYDFGRNVEFGLPSTAIRPMDEPDFFRARCAAVVIHDYDAGKTWLAGDRKARNILADAIASARPGKIAEIGAISKASSNFSRAEYIELVEEIKEQIRRGITYQTNLTQQLTVNANVSPTRVFDRLRTAHPAAFAAFMDRHRSQVVSASPELFLSVRERAGEREIVSSPIKGTRPRGSDAISDAALRDELLNSSKDRAENVMIVDLIRNDLGRICEFGSVVAENLCQIESHPTLFHLVSSVRGRLRSGVRLSEIIRATFPCGSITGAPKISTMQIIERLETSKRGLSMGAIGYSGPDLRELIDGRKAVARELTMSVAIRTMTCAEGVWKFNVGGGIVIDSDASAEYEETLTKARALLNALHAEFSGNKTF